MISFFPPFSKISSVLGLVYLFVLRLVDIFLRFFTNVYFACFDRLKYRQTASHTRMLKDDEESPTVLKSTAF